MDPIHRESELTLASGFESGHLCDVVLTGHPCSETLSVWNGSLSNWFERTSSTKARLPSAFLTEPPQYSPWKTFWPTRPNGFCPKMNVRNFRTNEETAHHTPCTRTLLHFVSCAGIWAGERLPSCFVWNRKGIRSPGLSCLVRRFCAKNGEGRSLPEAQCGSTDRSSCDRPFQPICTPMHSRMNAITRKIPCAVVGGMALVMRGA